MALSEAERARRRRHINEAHSRPLSECPYCPGTKPALVVPPPPPVTKQSPARMRANRLVFTVKDFLDAELALPDRHHGPKGRSQKMINKVQALADVDARTIGLHVEWALEGCSLGLLTPWAAAHMLAKSWT